MPSCRRISALLLALAAARTAGAQQTASPVGTWELVRAEGRALPSMIRPSTTWAECNDTQVVQSWATGGQLLILPDGRAAYYVSARVLCYLERNGWARGKWGTWTVRGDSIAFRWFDDREAAQLNDGSGQMRIGDFTWRRAAAEAVPFAVDTAAHAAFSHVNAAAVRRLATARGDVAMRRHYSCSEDQLTAKVPTVAEDTAGLGAMVASAAPGWHLATEMEIACRITMRPDSFGLSGPVPLHPLEAEPEFGSGRAWWVRPADLDGDGKLDRVVTLTSDASNQRGATLVVFGAGTSQRLDFDGATVRLRGAPVNPRRPRGCVLPRDAVAHAGTLYYWQDGQMVTLAPNQCPSPSR
ncbi:hypothetical protein [Longimicrobium sp.]|uniref:hypothetical protein n=1 Tax=Longimicrobium sp. TaxID=2029185 RepID=UPI002C36CD29|nr:hypothetical protein [Longimicrobium sp.]HSU13153.1 hypothetical protein [Longimicrobium sp.]